HHLKIKTCGKVAQFIIKSVPYLTFRQLLSFFNAGRRCACARQTACRPGKQTATGQKYPPALTPAFANTTIHSLYLIHI
ncbi:hypothetical protein, partial [Enterobacter hormaechei]